MPLFIDVSYREGVASSIKLDDGCMKQIEKAIKREDVPGFVELINNLPSHQLNRELDRIRDLLTFYDSPKCSAAVLDGQTKITEIPRVTAWLSKVDSRPLHYAVRNTASKITALLLQRGFSADVRRDYDDGDEVLKNVLPLYVVLSQLRFNHRKELSAVELILNLCNIHYYRRRLETLRVIALNTTEVKREFFNYLKEGKMIEVGALLLVAKSQILSPLTAKGEGEFRSISEILDFVLNTVCSLKTSMELRKGNELFEMTRTLDLLMILDKIGDKLAALLRIDFTQTCLANSSMLLAESLIEDAGFNVNYFCESYSYARSEAESYFLKEAIDATEKTIRTSEMLPVWVKEAALTGLGVNPGRKSRFTYPFLAKTLPHVNSVPVASPMKKTAPYQGMMKRVFRHGKLLR